MHPKFRRSSTASCAARRRWCCFASWRAMPAPGRNSAPAACLDRGPLSLREREIVIDRTCARTGCEYEWGVHVATFAEAAHLTEATGPRHRARRADAACWSAAEQALIAAVDALHDRATLSDAEFAALSAHYDEAQIFEIILLCGFYRTVSYLANGLALPLEEKAARFPPKLAVIPGRCEASNPEYLEVPGSIASRCPGIDVRSLRHARAQKIVQMHDADRLAGVGHDQRR